MSVLIKGMKMPKTCEDCQFHRYHSHHEYVCVATPLFYPMNLANSEGIRKDWCPLVELPEKHGRLIDADAFADRIKSIIERQGYDDSIIDGCLTVGEVLNAVIADLKGMTLYGYEDAPTVIEAEEEF